VPGFSYEKTYAMLTASEVFRRLIPEAKEWPASFETAGHVAHVNLRAEMLQYKRLIGQVLLDKNRNLRTVVNKTSHIATEFRTFPMEVIAGEDDTVVEVREGGARFRFDFREVYWNSRLQYEHSRVVKGFRNGDVVCDMMAGIGPFAIPAAMKGCVVYANDLNPRSHACLVANGKLNKGCADRLHASNQCGRDFVRRLAAEQKRFDHVVMNLPATAIEFLDVFRGLLVSDGHSSGSKDGDATWWKGDLPLVHCYCFSTSEDRKIDVLRRVAKVIGLEDDIGPLVRENASVHEVRDVAPHKWMMCAEFRLPRSVMFDANGVKGKSEDGPAAKRRRTEV
jgi:tRNA (guanine37-N1)-methyltransferase